MIVLLKGDDIKRLIKQAFNTKDRDSAFSKEESKQLKISILVVICSILLLSIILILDISSSIQYIKDKNSLYSTYTQGFDNKRLYSVINMETANIIEYNNGIIKTDLGEIQSKNVPTTDVIIIFRDIYGMYHTADELNSLNRESQKLNIPITYVTQDYTPSADESTYMFLSNTLDKLEFKNFEQGYTELQKVEFKNRCLNTTSIVILGITLIALIITYMIMNNLNKKLAIHNLKPEIALEEDLSQQKQSRIEDIKRSGIGSDIVAKQDNTDSLESEVIKALSNEGGVYTGGADIKANTSNHPISDSEELSGIPHIDEKGYFKGD